MEINGNITQFLRHFHDVLDDTSCLLNSLLFVSNCRDVRHFKDCPDFCIKTEKRQLGFERLAGICLVARIYNYLWGEDHFCGFFYQKTLLPFLEHLNLSFLQRVKKAFAYKKNRKTALLLKNNLSHT